jgi:hypothetical protein
MAADVVVVFLLPFEGLGEPALPSIGGQEPQVGVTDGVAQEDLRAAVSALGDVMRHFRDDDACDATHGRKVGQFGIYVNVS